MLYHARTSAVCPMLLSKGKTKGLSFSLCLPARKVRFSILEQIKPTLAGMSFSALGGIGVLFVRFVLQVPGRELRFRFLKYIGIPALKRWYTAT